MLCLTAARLEPLVSPVFDTGTRLDAVNERLSPGSFVSDESSSLDVLVSVLLPDKTRLRLYRRFFNQSK